jgi:hypothetical protein
MDIESYFDQEDFFEDWTQPIKINGKYYDTEDVTDPEVWLRIAEYFKDYNFQPMNVNIDIPDDTIDTAKETVEVFLLRILATGQLFTVSNIYDNEYDAIVTFYEFDN